VWPRKKKKKKKKNRTEAFIEASTGQGGDSGKVKEKESRVLPYDGLEDTPD